MEYGCHYDWFTWVFQLPSAEDLYSPDVTGNRIEQAIELIKSKLAIDDLNWIPNGQLKSYRYNDSIILSGENTIVIGFNHEYQPGDHIMVNMSGSGYDFWLRHIESKGLNNLDLEKSIHDDKVIPMRPSRLDVALDLYDFPKQFSPMYVNEITSHGCYIGRTKPTWVHSYNSSGTIKDDSKYSTDKEGTTLYFGLGGQKLLRIYNKKSERLSKKSKAYKVNSWYRWEFELRGVSASDFWNLYFDHDQNILSAWQYWLSSHYRWIAKVGATQKKRSRYPNADFYSQLIKGFEDAKPIQHEHEPMTYERTLNFVQTAQDSMLKLIGHDLIKYQKNGFSYEQAKRTAINNFTIHLERAINDNSIDYNAIENYFTHEQDVESLQITKELADESEEHRYGV